MISKGQKRKKDKIQWIVLHYTASPGCSAMGILSYFTKDSTKTSTHYIVDECGWLVCCDPAYVAWHCGGAATSRNGASNGNSIGVDICESKVSKKTLKATDDDWYFKPKTLENAARLVAMLMRDYDIDIDHVCRHFDVSSYGKLCPRPFCGDKQAEDNYQAFKRMVLREYEDLSGMCVGG